jgi:hypothetical protein
MAAFTNALPISSFSALSSILLLETQPETACALRTRPHERAGKFEEIAAEVSLTRQLLTAFQKRYNRELPYWALISESGGDPLVPEEVYVAGESIQIPKWQTWTKAAQTKLETLLTEEAA